MVLRTPSSHHAGVHSLGIILTIGIALVLVTSLSGMPAVLRILSPVEPPKP